MRKRYSYQNLRNFEIRNSKHETRNKYKIRIFKCSKRSIGKYMHFIICFSHFNFGHSDLLKRLSAKSKRPFAVDATLRETRFERPASGLASSFEFRYLNLELDCQWFASNFVIPTFIRKNLNLYGMTFLQCYHCIHSSKAK